MVMVQVRFHGRGGQGVVSAAEMLSVAAFIEGRSAQAFPSFGSERMGAPVTSFCRIDDKPIRLREPIITPDILVIQDPTLLHQRNLLEGLAPDGYVLLNSARTFEGLPLIQPRNFVAGHFQTLAATEIALHHLGRPMPNSVLLGGLAALTGLVKLESICAAIRSKFKGNVAGKNIAAATEAFEIVSRNVPAAVEVA